MIRSITIKHFRSFQELTLGSREQPLDRINLISGRNNTGKTAVLEALYLLGNEGTTEVAFELNHARGISLPRVVTRDTCSWMFQERDTSKPIEIDASGNDNSTSRLKMWLVQKNEEKPEDLPDGDELSGAFGREVYLSGYPYLAAHYVSSRGGESWSNHLLDESRTFFGSRESKRGNKCLYLSASDRLHSLYLEFFSRLEIEGRQDEMLPILRNLEQSLKRVTLVVVEGEPALYGDVGRKRLIPLTFMGEGVKRVLSILLAIANVPGGTLLIDEIENGLHYSVQSRIWQAIARAARQADVQIFATTHSYECIQAAHKALTEDGRYDLRLLRLDRVDSEIRAATYDQATLETSVDMNLEVR